VSDPKAPIQGIGQGNICGLTGWIIFEYSHDGNVKSLGLFFGVVSYVKTYVGLVLKLLYQVA
jgi:hypothetical protein